MSTPKVSLSPRDLSLLRFLSFTPATTDLLLRVSSAFSGGPFTTERRIRERLQELRDAGIVRAWTTAHAGGGLQNYSKLTRLGWQLLGESGPEPSRVYYAEVPPSLEVHTFRLSEAIGETVRACAARRVMIERFIRENELTLAAGDLEVQPDCFFRLAAGGRRFNLAFEMDNSQASVESYALSSIRRKLTAYHAYQELVLSQWLASRKKWERPRLRVVFLTKSVERAYHILALAAEHSCDRRRRFVYAATLEAYLADADPLCSPLFLDHFGCWQSLIDLHPTAPYQKPRVRLVRPVESLVGV